MMNLNINKSEEIERIKEILNGRRKKLIADKIKFAKTEKAKKGLFNGGYAPFGYRVNRETQQINIDWHERRAVLFIFDAITKDMSYEDIAKCVNALGYRTRAGLMFSSRSIERILGNEIYTGITTYRSSYGTIKLKQMELRIITEKEFAETKYLLRHPKRKHAAFEGNRIMKLYNEA